MGTKNFKLKIKDDRYLGAIYLKYYSGIEICQPVHRSLIQS
jgi:hypothetical protein